VLVAVAVLFMGAAFFLPLWRISLIAPQYPEGLGMLIRISNVVGAKEGDLQSINGLNHYIGMKVIEPDTIPELRFMPYILGFLVLTGLLVSALGARRALIGWAGVLAATLIAGLADYWKWGYDYGHDLSPDAIIKIPGMTYQPPLIGSKQLLNFVATSWPASGGWLLIAAAVLVAAAIFLAVAPKGATRALALVGLAACAASGPQPIVLGQDACDYCRMTIADSRYGGEAITTTGRVHKFDGIECLAGYMRTALAGTVKAVYVIDLQHPGTLVPAESAGFLKATLIHSAMGKSLVGFASPKAAEEQRAMLGGATMTWAQVLADSVPAAAGATSTGRTITEMLAAAHPGDHIFIDSGTYREPTLVVRTPNITIEGRGWPVLDGNNERTVLLVEADDVTVRGLVVMHTGVAQIEDRAGIRVQNAHRCLIENNRLVDNLFGIYLQSSSECTVRHNDVSAHGLTQNTSGNGIHLWYSPYAVIEDNHVHGHRDGIYFEFSQHGVTRNNVSERSERYGLHFMFSDSCRYEHNIFRDNNSGVAVMYSRGIIMKENRFERSWGGAAYGLLLKEILGGEISGNIFDRNSTGIYLEGSSHLTVRENTFIQNGWAVKLLGDAEDDHFTGNSFSGNAFDVSTNSTTTTSTFDGNWWDAYRGYDLDHDGTGDVPFYPVRLFALVVEQHPPALVLLRSPLVGLLDAAEHVLPVLTPAAIVDPRPLMRPPVSP
jgi:nitrous oxidase accessory protein